MKNQKTKIKNQNFETFILILFLLVTCHLSLFTAVSAAEWGGVDESVVEKYAEEHGRAARAPFINTDQGDLLLFVFLLAGAVGGFAAGYYWRELMENRTQNPKVPGHRAQTG
jgi:ABC-type cobalt transport system substrate-binding protein